MDEVVVVGAGPAGSATAIYLARAGRRVRLIDRQEFPRRKACGEGLFPGGTSVLHELGVLPDLTAQSVVLKGIRFSLDEESAFTTYRAVPWPALGVPRNLLDACLLQRAQAEGVVFTPNATARLARNAAGFALEVDGHLIQPKIIVAADGLRSGLRQRARLDLPARQQRYGVSAHLLIAKGIEERVDVFYRRGYEIYVTPVGPSTVNVALLLSKERVGELAGRLREGFLQLLEGCPLLEGGHLVDEPLVAGPFPSRSRSVWRDNLVLVGDAAGFFDGITGDGMTQSLVSARFCAKAVDTWLSTGSTTELRRYERRKRSLARTSTLLARLNLALSARPAMGKRSLRNLRQHPETFERLIAVGSGSGRWRDFRMKDVLVLLFGGLRA